MGKRTKLSTHAMFFGVGALQTYVQKAHMKFDLLWSNAFHFVGTVNVEKKGTFPSCTITQCQKRFCGVGKQKGKFLSSPSPLFRQRWHQVQILGDWGGAGETSKGCHTKAILKYFFGGIASFFNFSPGKECGKTNKAQGGKLETPESIRIDRHRSRGDKRGRTGREKKVNIARPRFPRT